MPLEMVLKHLNINELYRLSWGAKNTHGAEWEKLKKDFDARLASMTKDASRRLDQTASRVRLLRLSSRRRGIDRLRRRARQKRSGSFQFVHASRTRFSRAFGLLRLARIGSVGHGRFANRHRRQSRHRFEELQAANDYTEAYFVHGLAVQAAEATADYMHNHIRRELGLGANQGKRYSWGYPAIPILEDHFKVFQMLPAAEAELGLGLSVSGQIIPEESTAAIVVSHKDAKYYTLGESRVEQLMR
jgi:5-methyltetrahydrofolate--homocysteine methyltransferase